MNNFKEEFAYYLWFWFKLMPSVWFGFMFFREYDGDWDKVLSKLIDQNSENMRLGYKEYTVLLGEIEVWVSDEYWYYGYELHRNKSSQHEYRPSARTMYKLDKIVSCLKKERAEKATQAYRERIESMLQQ